MKISTQIIAALLGLGIVSQAGADQVVYLTGSTAFRSTVDTALLNNTGTNNGGLFDAGSVTYVAYGNSNPNSANYLVVHGTINNGATPLYMDVAWSGSEAGIASASAVTLTNVDRNGNPLALAGSPEVWLNVSNVVLNGSSYATNPPASLEENNGVPSHGSDLAQADTSQAVSWTPAVSGTSTDLKDYGSEGVVTFTWSRNVQTSPTHEWLDCSNVTIPQLYELLSSGWLPASFISGNTNDNDMLVYCVGRNKGSGTRMNTLADTTYGTHNPVQQWSIGYGCSDPGDPPGGQQNALILTNEGDNGYESGGGVAKALSIVTPEASCQQADPTIYGAGDPGWFAMGYASPSDLLNAGVTTNYWVTVDGVMESNEAIENGSFWYWGHEHLYGKHNISGIQDTVGNTLFQAVKLTMASLGYGSNPAGHDPGLSYNYMNVIKTSDTAFPTP